MMNTQVLLKLQTKHDSEEIPADIVRILIRRFMSMPDEDVEFLRRDIPEETWEMLKNY